MAEDAVTEAATAAEEVSKKDDLEALKETAKEKLEAAAINGGSSDNDGDKAGNGATEASATNGHDSSIDETSNGTSKSAKGDEESETKDDDDDDENDAESDVEETKNDNDLNDSESEIKDDENDASDKNDEDDDDTIDKDPSEDLKSKDVSENVSENVSEDEDEIDELDKETAGQSKDSSDIEEIGEVVNNVNKAGPSTMSSDIEELDEAEDEEDELDDEEGEEEEESEEGLVTGENSAMNSGDEDDVQEVKEDSDSDVMEVDQDDPLAKNVLDPDSGDFISKEEAEEKAKAKAAAAAAAAAAVTSTEVKKPQVVTIDDPKALQALASSAAKSKAQADRDKVTIIDTAQILAGRSNSGVTITPAAGSRIGGIHAGHAAAGTGNSLPGNLASSLAASGVTISSKSTYLPGHQPTAASPAPVAIPQTHSIPGSNFVYDSKGQLQDPNLTDDTIVIEAPSFIVPYVYEKPPRESFQDFKAEIKKMMAEIKAKLEIEEKEKEEKEKEKAKDKDAEDAEDKEEDPEDKPLVKPTDESYEPKKKKGRKKKKNVDKDGSGEEDNGEKSDDEDFKAGDSDSEVDSDDSDIEEVDGKKRPVSPELPELRKPSTNFFESTLSKMVSDLGMNLVQESVQQDLLRQQQRKAKKEKSAAVMHAIMSLKQNIEQSKENNSIFNLEQRKCRYCSFKTESECALEHHLETPHMRHGLYRCNFCHYETKSPQEVLGHMAAFHQVKGRLERAPAPHQCPQCPFEDMMKGKLTRHKVGCDKRFKPEKNQEPPHDWEPPAKIPKPINYASRAMPGSSLLNTQHQQRLLNQAARGALQQFNQQRAKQPNLYSQMPALQFGPGGRQRPGFSRPFIPNKAGGTNQQQMNLPQFGQVGRLAGNPSVTIQSISKTGGFKSNNPSISITPVSGANRGGSPAAARAPQRGGAPGPVGGGLKPGAPASASKDNFVICEICDGYIRDLEQLRNHMQFIHKVKIHPKMIHNRPPLNCQKCQFRFFTDQGLERHLLGSHGLVTASMQDLANKGQDSGRCPVCGKMFHWKLLNHVAKDHMKTLKPAHLSYKCTVCTATFGQYKLFENHVYSAHSGGRKSTGGASSAKIAAAVAPKQSPTIAARTLKVSDEITIIPQGKNTQIKPKVPILPKAITIAAAPKVKSTPPPVKNPTPKSNDPDVIEIDDEEEEIDDVEEEGKRNGSQSPKKRKAESEDSNNEEPPEKSAKSSVANSEANSAGEESGEEGIEEIRDDDEVDDD